MFQPSKYQQKDINFMYDFIENYPLATLIIHNDNDIEANHIPMLLVKKNNDMYLQGHIAKANLIWKSNKKNSSVLAIFQAANAYISPNWYPTKKIDQKAVPTWNYVAVHAKGSIHFIEDKSWLMNHLEQLSNKHEKDLPVQWKISDAPKDYIQTMLKAIIGFEIKINTIIGKTKMNQNHPIENRNGAISGLKSQGMHEVAWWIKNPNKIPK